MPHYITLNEAAITNLLDDVIPKYISVREVEDGIKLVPHNKTDDSVEKLHYIPLEKFVFQISDELAHRMSGGESISVSLDDDDLLHLRPSAIKLPPIKPSATIQHIVAKNFKAKRQTKPSIISALGSEPEPPTLIRATDPTAIAMATNFGRPFPSTEITPEPSAPPEIETVDEPEEYEAEPLSEVVDDGTQTEAEAEDEADDYDFVEQTIFDAEIPEEYIDAFARPLKDEQRIISVPVRTRRGMLAEQSVVVIERRRR